MNIVLDIILVLIIVLPVISGFKKGIFKTVFKLINLIISGFLAYFLRVPVSGFLYNAFVHRSVSSYVSNSLKSISEKSGMGLSNLIVSNNEDYRSLLKQFSASGSDISSYANKIDGEQDQLLTEVSNRISQSVAQILSTILAVILVFIVSYIIFSLIVRFISKSSRGPVSVLNRTIGLILGLMFGLLFGILYVNLLNFAIPYLSAVAPKIFNNETLNNTIICSVFLKADLSGIFNNLISVKK